MFVLLQISLTSVIFCRKLQKQIRSTCAEHFADLFKPDSSNIFKSDPQTEIRGSERRVICLTFPGILQNCTFRLRFSENVSKNASINSSIHHFGRRTLNWWHRSQKQTSQHSKKSCAFVSWGRTRRASALRLEASDLRQHRSLQKSLKATSTLGN